MPPDITLVHPLFLSKDPIGFLAGDANLQRYVGNNAVNATDPSGLTPGALRGAANPVKIR